ncbi:hypothetical protein N7467_009712 [Penicillium canescens]|nr:hypothetical protein N7467_009712 [Penicillium canescens]
MDPDKAIDQYIEVMEDASTQQAPRAEVEVMGTVKSTEDTIVYIPAPTTDPRVSTLGVSMVSGFGGLITFYIPEYAAAGKDYAAISALMTYSFVGAVLCATATSYNWHLGARMVIGISAGQSEALVPMITQEVFFLHERSKFLMVQQTVQVILSTIFCLFASPIAGARHRRVGLAGAQCFVAFFFLPETKYNRDLSAYQEPASTSENDLEASKSGKARVMICKEKPPLDYVNFERWTWKSDMRLWIGEPEWYKAGEVLKVRPQDKVISFLTRSLRVKANCLLRQQTCELLFFPNVRWALCLNGLTIGTNIAMATTYGTILTAAPYTWPDTSTSYVSCGQIIGAIIALPLLGTGSDKLVRWRAERNGGIHEPETRILPLILPIIGAEHPEKYHWFVYVWSIAAYYFAFVGANIVAITYLLDSYPARAGPMLIIICAFRGFISFGTSHGTMPFVESHGYDGAFGTFGALTAVLGVLDLPLGEEYPPIHWQICEKQVGLSFNSIIVILDVIWAL